MADQKITDLTNYTVPQSNSDVLPIVDITNDITKKITLANFFAYLGSYVLTLTNKTINATNNTISNITEAMQTLADNTTNNATTGRHGYLKKLSNNAGEFMNGQGNWATPGGSGGVPYTLIATDFASIDRVDSTGTIAVGAAGLQMDTGNTASTNYTYARYQVNGGTGFHIFDGSPEFSASINIRVAPIGTDEGQVWFGLGGLGATTGTIFSFVARQIGFKLITNASTGYDLYATQGNNSTESASGILTTLATGDSLEVCLKVNGSASVDYYYRVNGAAWSAATNVTGSVPTVTTANAQLEFILNNRNSNNNNSITVANASYKR